jgi:hypothetical protein
MISLLVLGSGFLTHPSSLTDRVVRLLSCGRLIYTPRWRSSNDGRWYRQTNAAQLALLFNICGNIMGCGDVAVPTPRRNDSAWDVQLDDISLSGFGEMAKSTDAAVAQRLIEFFEYPRFFHSRHQFFFFELFGHSSVNLALCKYLSIKMIPWVPRDGDVNTDNVSGCSVRHAVPAGTISSKK